MKSWWNIGCIGVLVVLLMACTDEQTPEPQQGEASLTLQVATSAVSRATAPGDGDLTKGGGMEDLTVVLVNSSNVIAAIEQVKGLTGDEQKVKEVTIKDLKVGNYTLYAFANTEKASLDEAKTLLSGLKVDNAWSSTDAIFEELSNTDVPSMDDTHPLLLTASKEISIGIQDNETTIDLLRPIVWFQVKLHNHSEKEMTVSELLFSYFNPSTGYLLPHDGAVPSSVTYRSLPAYAGGISVGAGENKVVYDVALFENQAESYTMDMTLQTGTPTMETANSISTSTQYALKNRSTRKYLVDNNGTLGVASYTGVVPNTALWTFSGTNSGYLTNVGTGNKFYQNTQAATSGDNLTFAISNKILQISYTKVSWFVSTTYYLHENNNSVEFSSTKSNHNWQLQTITTATDNVSLEDTQLKTVNPETGQATPMKQQIRNQHITVTVNAYYNEQEGTFNFAVEPWTEKNAGVEFN